ncbi:MAG: hypothetical protein VXY47_04760 [Bacteroidota bacterium]|nr:hypothetical protein [Bacteroidota bacterium]MEC8968471.1 hypothetical protein [Bacteroidota bacterium]
MKKTLIIALGLVISSLLTPSSAYSQTYEYKIISSIESIIPMGLGRSRLIENSQVMDYTALTTERGAGNDTKMGSKKRSDAKIDNLKETKMLNFFSGVGINFRNIASNDALVTSMLNAKSNEGWELINISSGVESNAGKDDGQGVFITRFFFRRAL